MLNAQEENTLVRFRPFQGVADAAPKVRSIYYPKNRYGDVNERSCFEEFAIEVKGNRPE